jgi:hypothetical protein
LFLLSATASLLIVDFSLGAWLCGGGLGAEIAKGGGGGGLCILKIMGFLGKNSRKNLEQFFFENHFEYRMICLKGGTFATEFYGITLLVIFYRVT